MKERLRAADYRFIAICLTLFGASVWFAAGNFYRAFPEASIDFRVTRDEAQPRAQKFLEDQGYILGAYRVASSFSYDDYAKTFLEREAGLEKANQLMGTRVRLWRWAFRWYRPQEREEFRADITPTGDFVAFEHQIAEDAARPEISAEQARALAENFLRTRAHRDPASLDFVETSSVARPHRTDRSFVWKERDFDIHGGTYRINATVLGDEVGEYGEYVKVPDQWSRDYERLRSKNNEAQTFDTLAMLALMIALIVVLVKRVRRQDVRWRRAAMVGVIGMVLSFFASLNEFPLAEFGYRTTESYSSFLMQNLLRRCWARLPGAAGSSSSRPARKCCIAKHTPARSRWGISSAAADCAPSASSWARFSASRCARFSSPTRRASTLWPTSSAHGRRQTCRTAICSIPNSRGCSCCWAATCRPSPKNSSSACSPSRSCAK